MANNCNHEQEMELTLNKKRDIRILPEYFIALSNIIILIQLMKNTNFSPTFRLDCNALVMTENSNYFT